MSRRLAVVFICTSVVLIHCNANEPECCENSSFSECGTLCEPSCTDPTPKYCPACTTATPACRCDANYLRDTNTNQCVLESQCSQCPPGEALLACGRQCEGTCKSPYEPESCKTIACLVAGCGCDITGGYVRSKRTKTCVPKNECYCPVSSKKHKK